VIFRSVKDRERQTRLRPDMVATGRAGDSQRWVEPAPDYVLGRPCRAEHQARLRAGWRTAEQGGRW